MIERAVDQAYESSKLTRCLHDTHDIVTPALEFLT